MNAIRRHIRAAVAAAAIATALAAPAAAAGDIVIKRDGSKAVQAPPAAPPPASSGTADSFHLEDAGIGAAGMFTLVLGAAGVVALRSRRRTSRPAGAS
jgi:hypothetical protein